jgi:hypothetical protein
MIITISAVPQQKNRQEDFGFATPVSGRSGREARRHDTVFRADNWNQITSAN